MKNKDMTTIRLRFTYRGKRYAVLVNSIHYTGMLIVNKLRIGHARHWLILQNNVWRFVSDMPLCYELKNLLICKVATGLGLSSGEPIKIADQTPLRTGIMINAILSVLTVKMEIP